MTRGGALGQSPHRIEDYSVLPWDVWRIILGAWDRDSVLRGVVSERPDYLAYMGVGFQRRFLASQDLGDVLVGCRHQPVVYFARVGSYVKIGTSRNLRSRMACFYLGLEDVLAVMPGGRELEAAYHYRFRHSQLNPGDGRSELFFPTRDMRYFLWRLRASSRVRRLVSVVAERMRAWATGA